MGEVYRARDTRLDRDVAIKILPERLAGNAGLESRFAREAKAVASLSHPNILALHDIGIAEGIPFSVTELLEGATLRDRISGSPLPVRKAVDYALQTARGLAAAHDKGIVHRDLKPENIFITDDGRAKILDFGLARATETESGSSLTGLPTQSPGTEPGTVLGTVGYMSPEQVRGLPVDARSDLFSFGTVLYEMLSGRRAFQGDTAADTMTAVLREDPPGPRATFRRHSNASSVIVSRRALPSAFNRPAISCSAWRLFPRPPAREQRRRSRAVCGIPSRGRDLRDPGWLAFWPASSRGRPPARWRFSGSRVPLRRNRPPSTT
jgi:serine/threonine protein kinase